MIANLWTLNRSLLIWTVVCLSGCAAELPQFSAQSAEDSYLDNSDRSSIDVADTPLNDVVDLVDIADTTPEDTGDIELPDLADVPDDVPPDVPSDAPSDAELVDTVDLDVDLDTDLDTETDLELDIQPDFDAAPDATTPVCPDESWLPDDSSGGCYKLYSEEKTWGVASQVCGDAGARLMKMTPWNKDVIALLFGDDQFQEFWIGLRWEKGCVTTCTPNIQESCLYTRWGWDVPDPDNQMWSVSPCIVYTGWDGATAPWCPFEPNEGIACENGEPWCSTAEKCVAVMVDPASEASEEGLWANKACDETRWFVCEWHDPE